MSEKTKDLLKNIIQSPSNKKIIAGLSLGLVVIGLLSMKAKAEKIKYPASDKENVFDDYHGTRVYDYYRWLEDPHSEKTKKWVEAQNNLTDSFLKSVKKRPEIKEKMTEMWNYPKYSTPSKEGERYFYFKNDGLQNQPVFYMKESLDSEAKELLDPNKLSNDGTLAISSMEISKNGKYVAYGASQSGSDWQEVRIIDVDNNKHLDETLKWCRFAGIAWKNDNSGFFYNRYPDSSTVAEEDQNNYNRVYWHKLGTPQSEDIMIYSDDQEKELGYLPFISEDGKYLGLYVYRGTAPENRFYYKEAESGKDFIKLLIKEDASYNPVDIINDVLYIKTDLNAPRGKLLAIDLKKPAEKNWKEIIPEQKDVMSSVNVINQQLIVSYMHDAHHLIKVYSLEGKFIKNIELPAIGSVSGLSGRRDDREMFISFTSFTYPTTIFRYDFTNNKMEMFHKSEFNFNPDNYETKQIFYPSRDGTKIPMFLVYKKGLKLNGNNPTILYGYGGFNVSLTPSFSISRLVWMDYGGVYAIANLRGGGEYGDKWHKAGMLEKKQNVFDDFISGAEWLIANNYTSNKKLAIHGGSNGGLLVAATMLQRPELFGAVICSVPVIDMLRYHKFTIGRYWIPEYGNAEKNKDDFNFMYAYSPLHNIKKGESYPPTLITTADTDDRVVPAHANKFAAALQSAQKGKNPVLIRVELKAGHGLGKPTSKVIEEQSDIYSFLFKVFDIDK